MFSGHFTEEAFLLSSLNEIVKVWARGSGQAKFDLSICDGVADLSLNFKLGRPSDQHCDPSPQPSQHDEPDAQHEGEEPGQEPLRPVPQCKSQARRERNRLRAARHRAATAVATATSTVILPFKGKILPMLRKEEVTAAPQTATPTSPDPSATPTSSTSTTASTTGAAASAASPKLVRPVKASQTQPTSFDAKFVKKKLFPIPSYHVVPPRNPEVGKRKCYKMKEDDLWIKLSSS